MLENIKRTFVKDGKLDGKMVSSVVALLIVLAQEILAIFGIQPAHDLNAIVDLVNTILALLGAMGILGGFTRVKLEDVHTNLSNKIEDKANQQEK